MEQQNLSSGSAQDHLLEEIEKHISGFKSRKNYYEKGSFRLTITVATISFLVTALIGISEALDVQFLSLLALTLSSFLTITTAIDSHYSFKSRWIQNNITHTELLELKSNILFFFFLNGELTENGLCQNYNRLQDILKSANSKWVLNRTQKDSQ